MKRTYMLFQQYIAYALLISFFLQSCGGLNNPIVPMGEEKSPQIQTYTQQQLTPQIQTIIQPLVDQTVIAEGGHAVTFYDYKGELQASVGVVDEKDKVFNGIPVVIEKGTELASLPHLPKKIQQRRIQVQFSSKGLPTKIAVNKPWLMGGNNTGKGKEKSMEGEEQEESDGEKEQEDGLDRNHQELYKLATVEKEAEAQFKLGIMYHNGQGVDQDYTKAREWYTKAAEQGYAQAQNNLAYIMYKQGLEIAKDYAKAIVWFETAAEQGYAQAQYNLGVIYYKGEGVGVGKNYQEAFKWYEKAANQDHADAQYNLGIMYYNGRGVGKNYQETFKWYEKAANQGHVTAQYNLGVIYHNGQGVRQDYTKAREWYTRAADQRYAQAQYNLGCMYHNGKGVRQDYTKAREWYREAADQRYAQAQNNLGLIYQNGRGIDRNYAKARKWYQKAAKQELVTAQFNLGSMYEDGQGINKDYAKAHKWYTRAAEQGHLGAQFNLAGMYYNGRGVDKDYAKARKWYEKAAGQGHLDAKEALAKILVEILVGYKVVLQEKIGGQCISSSSSSSSSLLNDEQAGKQIDRILDDYDKRYQELIGKSTDTFKKIGKEYKQRILELRKTRQDKGAIQKVAISNLATLEKFYTWKLNVFREYIQSHFSKHLITYAGLASGTVARKPKAYESGLEGITELLFVIGSFFPPVGAAGKAIGKILGKIAKHYEDNQMKIKADKVGSLCGHHNLIGMGNLAKEVANVFSDGMKPLVVRLRPDSLDKLADMVSNQIIYAIQKVEIKKDETIVKNLLKEISKHSPSSPVTTEDGRLFNVWELLKNSNESFNNGELAMVQGNHWAEKISELLKLLGEGAEAFHIAHELFGHH